MISTGRTPPIVLAGRLGETQDGDSQVARSEQS
jgi:hypothetical protein